jgi:uncharacterized protein (DUF952 family)
MNYIYHICQREAWENALTDKYYNADSLETEGFIHCSIYEQLQRVANTFFQGRKDLVLLVIDPSKVKAEVKWEPAPDILDQLFPHIFGALNLDAVIRVLDLISKPDGSWIIPSV